MYHAGLPSYGPRPSRFYEEIHREYLQKLRQQRYRATGPVRLPPRVRPDAVYHLPERLPQRLPSYRPTPDVRPAQRLLYRPCEVTPAPSRLPTTSLDRFPRGPSPKPAPPPRHRRPMPDPVALPPRVRLPLRRVSDVPPPSPLRPASAPVSAPPRPSPAPTRPSASAPPAAPAPGPTQAPSPISTPAAAPAAPKPRPPSAPPKASEGLRLMTSEEFRALVRVRLETAVRLGVIDSAQHRPLLQLLVPSAELAAGPPPAVQQRVYAQAKPWTPPVLAAYRQPQPPPGRVAESDTSTDDDDDSSTVVLLDDSIAVPARLPLHRHWHGAPSEAPAAPPAAKPPPPAPAPQAGTQPGPPRPRVPPIVPRLKGDLEKLPR